MTSIPLLMIVIGLGFHAAVPAVEETDPAITVTLEAEWVLSGVDELYGLDVWESGSEVRVIFIDAPSGIMGSFDPESGVVVDEVPLDPANTCGWGVAFNNDPDDGIWHVNDWFDTELYRTEDLSSWYTVSHPAGYLGRGMDFDGTDYWETSGDAGVYRFQPGSSAELIPLPEVPGTMSGLAVFPFGSQVGIVVTCYSSMKLYFYAWDGAEMEHLGSADLPGGAVRGFNHGLAYCTSEDALYWSYYAPARTIARLSFDIESTLDASTWGAVKGAF